MMLKRQGCDQAQGRRAARRDALRAVLALLALTLLWGGCGDDDKGSAAPANNAELDAGPDERDADEANNGPDGGDEVPDADEGDAPDDGALFPNLPGGNPLVPEVAAYPFPSDFYLTEDPETLTGRRLNIPVEAFPEATQAGAATFNGVDGYSPMPLLVAYLPGGVDIATLPSPTAHAESVSDDSTVWLVEMETGDRVPLLAEIDVNHPEPSESSLLIRPLVVLKPNTGYVVIIRQGVKAIDGSLHEANDAFVALRDGLPTEDPSVEAQRGAFVKINEAISGQGLEPEAVVLAWSFHTRSEASMTGPLLAAQQDANVAPLGDYTITEDTTDEVNRQIRGTFTAPNYADPETGVLQWDPQTGEITQFGQREVRFVMTIPNVVDEPRPVIMYGHGFLGDSIQATRGRFNRFCNENRFSVVATEFGVYDDLFMPLGRALGGEAEQFDVLVTEVLQSFTNTTHLTRIVKERLAVDLTAEGPGGEFNPVDPTAVHYLGISNGGTFGYVHGATSPQVERAVFLVGGGGLVHFLERAEPWKNFSFAFKVLLPDPRELQLLFALIQQKLDLVDATTFARRLVNDRYPGLAPLKAQVHMAVNDSQVRNLVTEWVVRTAEIPMVVPSAKDVFDLTTIERTPEALEGAMSVFYVYDEMVDPTPFTNETPLIDNDTHGTVRDLMSYRAHAGAFLETGTFTMVCDGACDPE